MDGLASVFFKQETEIALLSEQLQGILTSINSPPNCLEEAYFLTKEGDIPTAERATFAFGNSKKKATNAIARTEDLTLLFCGKLCNVKELSTCIRKEKTDFDLLNDAEIALQIFILYGVDGFAKLSGRWSLVLVDFANQKFYALSEKSGGGQLYYCIDDEKVCVSSSLFSIFKVLKNGHTIDRQALETYLLYGKFHNFIFKHITPIPVGGYLVYSFHSHTFETHFYYTLAYKNCKAGYNKYEEQLRFDDVRYLIFDAIRKRLSDCQRIAAIFTGTLENAALICATRKICPNVPITVFATSRRKSALSQATEAALRQSGVEWVEIPMNPVERMDNLRPIFNRYLFPFLTDVEGYLRLQILQSIRQRGFTFVLTEDGARELFVGYDACHLPFLDALRNQWMFGAWFMELLKAKRSGINLKELFSLRFRDLDYLYFSKRGKNCPQHLQMYRQMFTNPNLDFFPLLNSPIEIEVLNDYLYLFYSYFLTQHSQFSRFIYELTGIELISPFAEDASLVEYVFSLPSTLKIHNGYNFYLLRGAMIGLLDDALRWATNAPSTIINSDIDYLSAIGRLFYSNINTFPDPLNIITKDCLLQRRDNHFLQSDPTFRDFIFRYWAYLYSVEIN